MPTLTISNSTTTKSISSSPAKAFEKVVFDPKEGICVKATNFGELRRLFNSCGAQNIISQQVLQLPLANPDLSESQTVLSCCHPDIEHVRKLIAKYSDMKIIIMMCVAEEIQKLSAASSSSSGSELQNNNINNNTNSATSTSESADGGMQRRRQRLATTPSSASSSSLIAGGKATSTISMQQQTKLVTFYANVIGLLYGLVFPAQTTQPVACAALVEEKEIIENSEQYASANATERRKAMQTSVLCVFSDKGQRFYFSKVWTNVLTEVLSFRAGFSPEESFLNAVRIAPENSANSKSRAAAASTSSFASSMHILSLHLLTDVNNSIIPWLTTPLLLSEPLTEAYRDGGLLAVLALEGLLTLIVSHGLEYPKFYSGLYALVTPDIFSSNHRNRFFRLLHLALTSLRVSGSIAASFIKKLARVALICPSPALYFVLPFIRQKLQQHKNCFALIHRSLRDVDEEEAEVEREKKKQFSSSSSSTTATTNAAKSKEAQLQHHIDRVERLKKLFEGVDCFDPKELDPEKSHAIDSTLWELAALEKHYLPAVRNAVAAFASPAEDNQNLQFERSYARLFAHSMSMTETSSSFCTVIPPPSSSSAYGSKRANLYVTTDEQGNETNLLKDARSGVAEKKRFFQF